MNPNNCLPLDEMIKLYEKMPSHAEGQLQALEIILQKCYYPQKNRIEQTYDKNKKILSTYPYNYIDFMPAIDEFSGICLPRDNTSCYFFFPETKTFSPCVTVCRISFSLQEEVFGKINTFDDITIDSAAMAGAYHFDDLNYIKWETDYSPNPHLSVNGFKVPVYCVWENCLELIAALHLFDFETLFSDNRMVCLPHNNILDNYFLDKSSIFPNAIITHSQDAAKFREKFNSLAALRQKQNETNLEIVNEYCHSFNQEYYRKLFEDFAKNKPGSEKIRILCFTSLFTSAVQYSTRDCHEGALELGLESRVLIEKDKVHVCTQEALIEEIARFKPHIIFRINFSRHHWSKVPANIIWISWWQDNMISPAHVKLIGQFDVFFKQGKNRFHEATEVYGVEPRRIHVQDMAANLKLANRYRQEDIDSSYKADIAFITHDANIEKGVETYLEHIKLPDNSDQVLFRNILTLTIQKYIDILETSDFIYFDKCMFADILAQTASEKKYDLTGVVGIDPKKYSVVMDFIANPLDKAQVVKWLFEAGFNVKVWGRDWPQLDWAKPIAMGAAENESIRKIHAVCPIGLSVNPITTIQHRTFEIMSCGALCLVKYLPSHIDIAPITDYFVENEDFVFFYNKKDLLTKTEYYLKNRDELNRIAENGKKKVYEKYSYTNAMRNMLNLTFKTVTHE